MTRRRSSASITLILIGSAALGGCSEEVGRRDVYRSQADCLQDWGNDPARCERVRSGSHSGYYYGPYYRGGSSQREVAGTTAAPRQGSSAIGSTRVTKGSGGSSSGSPVSRSGFGSSSSAHAGSSSS